MSRIAGAVPRPAPGAAGLVLFAVVSVGMVAHAQSAAPGASAASSASASASAAPVASAPAKGEDLVKVLTPKPVEVPVEKVRFNADPVGDGAVLAFGVGFGALSTLIISTGEIHPQAVVPNQHFLGIDQTAVDQKPDPKARTFSNLGLYAAVAYSVIDPIADGLRERDPRTTLVDFVLYAEVLSINLSATNLAKIAVRRPRPYAYINYRNAVAAGQDPATAQATSTDASLSFFSGHASTVAAVSSCATYLAFARSPNGVRPWITLGVGVAATTFVSIERVRLGDHFPTDVIAGSLIGSGIGLLIPYLHRADAVGQRPIWVGYSPASNATKDGGILTLSGVL